MAFRIKVETAVQSRRPGDALTSQKIHRETKTEKKTRLMVSKRSHCGMEKTARGNRTTCTGQG